MRFTNRILISFAFLLFFVFHLSAQQIAIGEWRDHLPYNTCISVTEAENIIYCATLYNLFSYDKDDNSIQRMTKISGLSDIGISTINYNKKYKTLVIAYNNTNIDLIQNDEIINISDIKRKSILGNKTINNILFIDKYAYLSCGFGIVVLDYLKKEIKDTYYIGPDGNHINVLDLTFDDTKFYAATESGIFSASINDENLANFAAWTKDTLIHYPNAKYNLIEEYNNKIFANNSNSAYNTDTVFVFDGVSWDYFDSTITETMFDISEYYEHLVFSSNGGIRIYDTTLTNESIIWTYNPGIPSPRDAIIDKDDFVWIADNNYGLVKNINIWRSESIKPNGPSSKNVVAMSLKGNDLWVATGGKSPPWGNLWMNEGIFSFIDEDWETYNYKNISILDTIRDFVAVAVNPNNTKQVFVGTWGYGIIEFNNGNFTKFYNKTNSTLQEPLNHSGWIGVTGLCFDEFNNLWATDSSCTNALSVRKSDGSWKSFSLSPLVIEDIVGDLIIDSYNQKWIIMPRGHGIIVYNDNNTIDNVSDDNFKKLNNVIGNGNLPSNDIFCLAQDLDGEIWVGTGKGITVFYSPENVFSNTDFDYQQILVEQDGVANYLLETETITAIAVDGSNKKWIGTQRAGVFLMSEDGTKQIHHFTEDNSPLFSNAITSIAINHESGEVFFGTNNGIISYKGKATEGGETHQDVYAYPNPVKENYNGYIAIKGLVQNAHVKITDISGTLIYKTIAEGGQAVWDGKNFNGERAHSGVYLVFSSNDDGSETLVTKILFIN